MQFVTGDDVSQRAHGKRVLARCAPPQPVLFVEIAQQRNSGAPHRDEFFDQVRQSTVRKRTITHVVILLKPLDGCGIRSCNAQGAIGKDALGVAHVAQNFLGAPLAGRVPKVPFFFVPARKQQERVPPLLLEDRQNILTGNEGDVAIVLMSILTGLWPAGYGRSGGHIGNWITGAAARMKGFLTWVTDLAPPSQ